MTTVTRGPKWKIADLAWFGLAVATHAGLLLLPLGVPQGKPPSPQRLAVELVTWRAQAELPIPDVHDPHPETVPPADPPNPEPLVEALPRETVTRPSVPLEQLSEPVYVTPESEPVETVSLHRLSAALLMNASAKPDLPQVEDSSRETLGVHSPRALPANWQRGNRVNALLVDEPGLDLAMAPAQTEIVDRWLDAQGAQNVVVTLPNGETFCGRALAWDPMQPLVEHIMMFRSCGGGGTRSFDMASRPTPRWSTAE